jgi:hypothetical protein
MQDIWATTLNEPLYIHAVEGRMNSMQYVSLSAIFAAGQ